MNRFQEIFQKYESQLVKLARTHVSSEDAEDVLQSALANVIARYGEDASLTEQDLTRILFRAVNNGRIDLLRRKAGQKKLEQELYRKVSERMENAMRQSRCVECIREVMDRNDRDLLILGKQFFEGLDQSQIAVQLGLTIDSVKKAVGRGKRKISKNLKARCDCRWLQEVQNE